MSKNTIGKNLTVTIFGESHGPAIGAVMDGLPSGIRIDTDLMNEQMNRRRAAGKISTARHEKDQPAGPGRLCALCIRIQGIQGCRDVYGRAQEGAAVGRVGLSGEKLLLKT